MADLDGLVNRKRIAAIDGSISRGGLPKKAKRTFSVTQRAAIPLLNVGYDPDTYSAGLIEFVSAFVSRRGEITAGEITAWAADLTSLGPAYFFSLNRYLFVGVRG